MKNKDREEVQKACVDSAVTGMELESLLEPLGYKRGTGLTTREWLNSEYLLPLSDFEKEFLSRLDESYHWIIRGDSGCLAIFEEKPELAIPGWVEEADPDGYIPRGNFFKSLKWEDHEPLHIDDYVDRKKK